MRAADVVVIGTMHHIQNGKCSASEREEFEKLLRDACMRFQVLAVADETNAEALAMAGVARTIGAAVADELGLKSLYIEPDTSEREVLGIAGEQGIQLRAFFGGWQQERTAKELALDFAKREAVWLERLQAANLWPYLLVCGAQHVESFSSVLKGAGKTVRVHEQDWPESKSSPA